MNLCHQRLPGVRHAQDSSCLLLRVFQEGGSYNVGQVCYNVCSQCAAPRTHRGALSWSIVDFVDYITKVLHGHLHHGQVMCNGACAHRVPWSHAKFGLPEVNW